MDINKSTDKNNMVKQEDVNDTQTEALKSSSLEEKAAEDTRMESEKLEEIKAEAGEHTKTQTETATDGTNAAINNARQEISDSTDDKPAATPCGHCREEASQQCSQCKNMRCCSLECQQADWRFHKVLCRKYVAILAKGRPNEDARLAIMMKQDAEEPELVWIPCKGATLDKDPFEFGDDDEDQAEADFQETDFLTACELANELGVPVKDDMERAHLAIPGSFCAEAERTSGGLFTLVCGKRGHGELLAYSVRMARGSAFMPHESKPNKCLARFLPAQFASRWKGSVILFATMKSYLSFNFVDIDTRSFTLALDRLYAPSENYAGPLPPKKVKGVKVSAVEPHFTDIAVPVKHPAFAKGPVSKISRIMGYPVRTYKQTAQTPSVKEKAATGDEPANPAAWLLLDTDTSSSTFGSIPSSVKTDPTTILVVAAAEFQPFPLTVDMLTPVLDLLKNDVSNMLSDTSYTLEQRCKMVQAKASEEMGLLLGDMIAVLQSKGLAGSGGPAAAASNTGPGDTSQAQ